MAGEGTLSPTTPDGVLAAVQAAVADRAPLIVRGRGTKDGLGHAVASNRVLDLSGLTGVTLYEPEELVLSALAGTPMAEIEALLDANGQELAFEPPMRHLIWGLEDAGTIGGAVMVNAAGPRRVKAGAARDHVLGMKAVSGRGEAFKAGGRVVKNVTGYDLSKGLAGSFGTLAVATEITVKVLPKAETTATLVLHGLSDRDAVAALAEAMGAPVEAAGAAHLPAGVATALDLTEAATVVRLEGVEPSVAARFERLATILRPRGRITRLEAAESAALWRALRDGLLFSQDRLLPLWRVSVAPTAGPSVAEAAQAAAVAYDWAGGLVWLAMDPAEPDAGAARIRAAVKAAGGGHATLMRGSDALRAAVPVFEPEMPSVAALTGRLRHQFDPLGVLNPGRMGAGR
ncbi:glycolate oxidase subunit GlcE [Chthonobacter albigriseus]|uniref:glycolate oxidase subunit GlcE n=1 Tax=Chthonobacter albigriseus TaxID=1683161 RepID=UPI0015EEF21A|nr:glycolate oxidase subunit GlcE [Chthonobacter albigriseus]